MVLAAGTSSRFGSAKQLAELGGQPLVLRAVRRAEEVLGNRSVLVAGHEWQRVDAACQPLQGFLVVNEAFRSGLGGSIAAGVGVLNGVASGVLLLLADQAKIEARYLRQMIRTWQQNPQSIVVSQYSSIEGPPVIFPAACFPALCTIEGDRGARQVLKEATSEIVRLACEDAAIDIDSPGDLKALDSA